MKKSKLYKILCLTLGVGVLMTGTVLNASSFSKTLKAIYNNIGISYNGQTKMLSSQPFTVNGVVYVPLRAVGEIMGANVTWANNTVYINGGNTSNVSAEQEIAAKNFEIASLKQQLEVAKTQLGSYTGSTSGIEGSNLTTTAIDNTLSKITDTYSEDNDVDWEFELKLVSGRLELTVSYDSKYDDDDFEDISDDKLKKFVKEICYDIASNHKNVEIRGTVEDSRDDVERADFRYSKSGSYEFDTSSYTSLNDLEVDLEREYTVINQIGFSIPIDNISLEEDNDDELTIELTTNLKYNSNDYRERWNDLDSSFRRELKDYIEDMIDDIKEDNDSYNEIVCVIKDTATGGVIASYDDGTLSLRTVDED